MSDDFWGGMFDFNGDGKTSWDEELLGLAIMEDALKSNNDTKPSPPIRKPKQQKTLPKIKPVPEIVNESNYPQLCAEYKAECVCAIIALAIMMIPAIVVLWAVYSTYDPNNDANDFIIIVFTIAGFLYSGVLIHTTGQSIKTSIENLATTKERYLLSKRQNESKNEN